MTEARIDDNLDFAHGGGIEEIVYKNYGEIVRTWWGTISGGTF